MNVCHAQLLANPVVRNVDRRADFRQLALERRGLKDHRFSVRGHGDAFRFRVDRDHSGAAETILLACRQLPKCGRMQPPTPLELKPYLLQSILALAEGANPTATRLTTKTITNDFMICPSDPLAESCFRLHSDVWPVFVSRLMLKDVIICSHEASDDLPRTLNRSCAWPTRRRRSQSRGRRTSCSPPWLIPLPVG
jgi:hypothetical protein